VISHFDELADVCEALLALADNALGQRFRPYTLGE
jgi:hypothetical protein